MIRAAAGFKEEGRTLYHTIALFTKGLFFFSMALFFHTYQSFHFRSMRSTGNRMAAVR